MEEVTLVGTAALVEKVAERVDVGRDEMVLLGAGLERMAESDLEAREDVVLAAWRREAALVALEEADRVAAPEDVAAFELLTDTLDDATEGPLGFLLGAVTEAVVSAAGAPAFSLGMPSSAGASGGVSIPWVSSVTGEVSSATGSLLGPSVASVGFEVADLVPITLPAVAEVLVVVPLDFAAFCANSCFFFSSMAFLLAATASLLVLESAILFVAFVTPDPAGLLSGCLTAEGLAVEAEADFFAPEWMGEILNEYEILNMMPGVI